MLYLRTGLPGASKTLNTLKEICEDLGTGNRPIYYNNIKLLMLDFEVCQSFSGFFYGHFLTSISKSQRKKYQKILLKLHAEDELATLDYFPQLEQVFDAWLSNNGHVELWLKWVRRCYPPKKLEALDDYLNLGSNPNFEELERFHLNWISFKTPTLWYELERNSVIVIDECQQWFPPRGPGSKVPRHCAEFETHRHKGYDVHLITQDAKLLDPHVRRLTGRHIHYFNPFTSSRVTRYQGDKVFDPSDYFQKKNTQSKIIKRDKNFYGLYWSADTHTHKFKLPKKALLLIPILIIVPLFVWIILSGVLVGSPDNEVLVSTDITNSSVRDSAVHGISSNDLGLASQETLVLPSASFSMGSHPLAAICNRIVYASRIFQRLPRGSITTHLLQCETRNTGASTRPQRATATDEEAETAIVDEFEVFTMDSNFLIRLGYRPAYEDGLFTLSFENLKFVFPPM